MRSKYGFPYTVTRKGSHWGNGNISRYKGNGFSTGFSLLESLLYLAIFAIIGGSLFGILTNVTRISTREISGDEVASQLQFAMETVTRLVQSSSNIEMDTATATTTLKLRMADPALDPTCISLVNGSLKLSQGPDALQPQNCSAPTTDITTSKIIVDNVLFKRVEFPGGHDQVAVDLQFSNTATGPGKISRALRSGIARVSAATFDSDLLPNSDNSYEVGFSGTKRWKNISISNVLNLGVISADPAGIDGSIYYNSTSKAFRGKANGIWGDLGSSLWVATSTNSMYSNVSGNVGIGTVNPSEKLDILGNAKISGTIATGKMQMVDVVTEGSACSSTGLVARNTAGSLLSCQSGVWKKSSIGGPIIPLYLESFTSNQGPPAACPSGWTQVADLWVIGDTSDTNANERRVCIPPTGQICSILYFDQYANSYGPPPACPSGMTQADYKGVYVGQDATTARLNYRRSCFVCQ